MTPSDLTALRALVETANDLARYMGEGASPAGVWRDFWVALPAAQEALAQVERDAAYWRKRAESAEALATWQEARITTLSESLRNTLDIVRAQAPDVYEALDDSRATMDGHDG